MRRMARLGRVGLLLGLALALVLAVALPLSLRRVPEGAVGVSPCGTRGPGWAVQAPWARIKVLPGNGRLEVPEFTVQTREGSSVRFRVRASYALGTRLDPGFRSEVWRSGIEEAAFALVRKVLVERAARLTADEILAGSRRLEADVRKAFLAAGASADPVELTSNLADPALARRRTEEARRLARPPRARLLIVGWDGADWEVIRPLLAGGRLPNLARLVREGAHARLRSIDPMFSPLLWTTVATGKPPSEHGVADFLVRDPATGERRPITSDFRRVKALWNILPEFDIPSGWISWWASYPAEPTLGIVVTNLVASAVVRSGPEACAGRRDLAHPADYLAKRSSLLVAPSDLSWEEINRLFPLTRDEFARAQTRAPVDAPDPDSKEPPDPVVFTVKLLCAMRTYHNLALDMIRQGLPVVAVYYEGVDMMGHRFQHYMPPKMAMASDAEYSRFQRAVTAYYELQDEMLGELLAAAARDTVTILLSDHGFATGDKRPTDVPPYTSGQPAEWHAAWGILVVHGPGIRSGEISPASLYDIAPTVLYLLGLPLAKDMPGRLLSEAFRPGLFESRPPTWIPTYEAVGERLAKQEGVSLDQEAMAEMVANLRAVGYVGGGPDGQAAGEEGAEAPAATGSEISSAPAETQVFYHRNLATHHIKQGNLAEAEAELLAANARRPMPKTFGMLAEVRAAEGRFLEAAAALEEGLQAIPDQMEPESLLWLAEMYLKAGRREEAARVPVRWGPRATRGVRLAIDGRLAEEAGDVGSAVSLYEAALAQDPLLVHIALRLRSLYGKQGRPEAIEPFARRGLEVSPRVDAYHNLLGEVAKERGDFRAALAHFRKAVDLAPDDPRYLGNLAIAAAAVGNRKEAREAVDWAVRQSPRQPEAWLLLGSALDRLGDPAGALEAFGKARELGAEGVAADIGTALVLARIGRVAEARRLLAEAERRHPGSPAVAALSRRLSAGP